MIRNNISSPREARVFFIVFRIYFIFIFLMCLCVVVCCVCKGPRGGQKKELGLQDLELQVLRWVLSTKLVCLFVCCFFVLRAVSTLNHRAIFPAP